MRKWANDTKTWLLGSNQCVYVILIPLTFHLIYFRIFRFSFSFTFLLLMIHLINVAVTSLWIYHAYLEKSFLFWFSRIKTIFYASGFLEVPKRHLFCDHKHLRVCLCMSMSCPLLCVFSCWIKLKDIKEIGIRIHCLGSMFLLTNEFSYWCHGVTRTLFSPFSSAVISLSLHATRIFASNYSDLWTQLWRDRNEARLGALLLFEISYSDMQYE